MGGYLPISVAVCKTGVRVRVSGGREIGVYTDLPSLLGAIRGCGHDINDERWIRRAAGELAVFRFREGLGMADPYQEFESLIRDANRWRTRESIEEATK